MAVPDIPERYRPLVHFAEEVIPFNKHLGLEVISIREGGCRLRIPAAPHVVGDPSRPAVHGGVISTIADVAGGFACITRFESMQDRVSTVDLRIDYLRMAHGAKAIECDATVLRLGNKVAVTHMEIFSGDDEQPVAMGRGVYNVVRLEPAS